MLPETIVKKLLQRKEKDELRVLSQDNFLVDFYSNDYLGFAKNEILHQKSLDILRNFKTQNGATGSRLISGNFELFSVAENYIADFHKSESALIFSSGYDANLGIFSSIPQKGDLILYDELIHASIRDGITLSFAKSFKFKHNSTENLEELLLKFSKEFKNIFVATESVFSMDGDSPNLKEFVRICRKFNAFLIVDEAHSFGIYGEKGEGMVQKLNLEDEVFIRLVTFGKALGLHGAAVLAKKQVKDFLINFARSFIYTTAISPFAVASILSGYQILAENQENQQKLFKNIDFFKRNIENSPLKDHFLASNSPIQIFQHQNKEKLQEISRKLKEKSFGVKMVMPPTTPTPRLRICLHSFNTEEEILSIFKILLC